MTPAQAANRARLSRWWHRLTGCRWGRHRERQGDIEVMRCDWLEHLNGIEPHPVVLLYLACADCGRLTVLGDVVPSRTRKAA